MIVFDTHQNYDGSNPEGTKEIWLWEAGSGSIRAVTHNPTTIQSERAKISGDGRYVTFLSNYDYTGGSAIGIKVFLVDTVTGSIRMLTWQGTGADDLDHEIAPDGSRVLFETNIDLIPDDGLPTGRQLYAYHIQSQALVQVTRNINGAPPTVMSEDARYRYLEVARDVNRIAYRSEQSLDPQAGNPEANFDLFVGRPLDRDLDGQENLADCAPGDAAGGVPDEVVGVGFESETRLVWEQTAFADEYDVMRGTLADLDGSDYGACVNDADPDLTDTVFDDPLVPMPGGGVFYLVRARNLVCPASGPDAPRCPKAGVPYL
jgi:hypothetical protein